MQLYIIKIRKNINFFCTNIFWLNTLLYYTISQGAKLISLNKLKTFLLRLDHNNIAYQNNEKIKKQNIDYYYKM